MVAIAFGQGLHEGDVGLRLGVGRHPVVLDHGRFAGVVTCQRQYLVAVEALEQPGQVAHAATNVLSCVERIVHGETLGGGGHQLHQPLGAGFGNGVGAKRRFGMYHCADQRPVDTIMTRSGFDLPPIGLGVQAQ
ncbi:hypothetical protein D3C87_1472750 [compost metagenome]